jgi:hypothetical protein
MNLLAAALLRGRRLLFVQEKRFVDQGVSRELSTAGVEVVGPANDLQEAVALMDQGGRISGAIIDLEFNGDQAIGIARALLARGIPFVFTTDRNGLALARRYPGFVLCRKPIFLDEIATALFGGVPPEGSA